MSEIKQVIVIRKDLKMRRGKEIAQGSHASIAFLTRRLQEELNPSKFGHNTLFLSSAEQQWIIDGFAKICARVNSEKELLDIYEQALNNDLEVHLIQDSGHTEFNGVPTYTCLAIGPDLSERIDLITGHLKLY